MAFLWTPQVDRDDAPFVAKVEPIDVLYEMDDPLIFVAQAKMFPVLCFKIGDAYPLSQYVCVPTSPGVVTRLKEGKVSVRSAIVQPWAWIIEADDEFTVKASWGISGDELPPELLPTEGYGLYHNHGLIHERAFVPRESILAIDFKGGDTRRGTIPFNVLKTYVDAAYASIWRIFGPPLLETAPKVAEQTLRRGLSVPTYEPAYGSLSLSIEMPVLDFSGIRNKPQFDFNEAQQKMAAAHQSFLESAHAISEAVDQGKITIELARTHRSAMEAVTHLIPTSYFDAVEINGKREQLSASLRISSQAGQQLKEAYHLSLGATEILRGTVIEVNTSAASFIIRSSDSDRPVTCVGTTDEIKIQARSLQNGQIVSVSGPFEQRKRRHKLYMEHLKVLSS